MVYLESSGPYYDQTDYRLENHSIPCDVDQ